ncbi:L-asparaginase 2 [Shewanella sp. NFH-SH190041]|uniref:L-asparaginase 2 n=1 Tax=Shewanella sp. NFH-SH190041 TaxID=2950245 RepID=UPI0021C3BCF3|nr:L-asparaginase 2 [Shewanella sp. NFH-SH190041]BDM65843.1 L-asparaginase 2 [Shewanella sp. NFH-SH190041]
MRNAFFKVSMVCAAMLTSSLVFAADNLPNIKILATGGTIAGAGQSATGSAYTAGEVGVNSLINAVPELTKIANITGEQVAKIGSQDMDDATWLKLAKRVNELLKRDDVDGIVITHGTDTMEETAYFLNLTTHSDKPVVLVGAMRPSTAISADGPKNLYDAVVTAADKDSKNRGVTVVMNEQVFDADSVTKTNTTNTDTFKAPDFGTIGYVHDGDTTYRYAEVKDGPKQFFDVSKLTQLPKVGIVYNYANASDLPVKAFVDHDFKGIVSAGVGNGNMYHTIFDSLADASKQGIKVVRSSRVPTGATTQHGEVDDVKYGFIASEHLNPQKARILLSLALSETNDLQAIKKMFNNQ